MRFLLVRLERLPTVGIPLVCLNLVGREQQSFGLKNQTSLRRASNDSNSPPGCKAMAKHRVGQTAIAEEEEALARPLGRL